MIRSRPSRIAPVERSLKILMAVVAPQLLSLVSAWSPSTYGSHVQIQVQHQQDQHHSYRNSYVTPYNTRKSLKAITRSKEVNLHNRIPKHYLHSKGVTLRLGNKNDDTTLASSAEAATTLEPEKILLPILGIVGAVAVGICIRFGYTLEDIITTVETFIQNPQDTISTSLESIKEMGPIGAVYFGLFYLIAETLAVPATPLALSAGYLFGFLQGFTIVLMAATAAACIGFFVGKTYLRTYVEEILKENPKFAKIDRAVGEKGFKLLVLVRLSPIFPFSISNYVYGASSIDFVSYFWGTLLGFIPSTLAYVYTGMVGKEVMFGEGSQPWYIYVAGFGVLLTLLKLVTDVATGIIDAIDDEEK
jgi:uncharacterized membrane protein YdjX (TVP38/TMEM64 family)